MAYGKFRDSVLKDRKLSNTIEFKKMLSQIDKYWQSLFAAPVTVDTPSGRISIQPQRTNNIMEQFFRRLKRDHRRRTGDNSMARRLKTMNSNMPLVKNIENKQYMDILLEGKKSIEEVFAEIDAEDVRKEMNCSSEEQEKIPTRVKKMIKSKNFLKQMLKSVRIMTK